MCESLTHSRMAPAAKGLCSILTSTAHTHTHTRAYTHAQAASNEQSWSIYVFACLYAPVYTGVNVCCCLCLILPHVPSSVTHACFSALYLWRIQCSIARRCRPLEAQGSEACT